jgi:hypothetical protein
MHLMHLIYQAYLPRKLLNRQESYGTHRNTLHTLPYMIRSHSPLLSQCRHEIPDHFLRTWRLVGKVINLNPAKS